MKKVLKNKKSILAIFTLSIICLLSFSFGNTFVEVSGNIDDKKGDIFSVIEFIGENIYYILWPLLKIASVSITNDLVYGEIFGLDKYLWYIWNIMKNFANFAIGFIFFVSILAFLFGFKQNILHPKKLIPKLLVTSLLVNASWFLIMVLVDISTILVYTFGALPLNFFKSNEVENKGVLMLNYISEVNKDSPIGSGENKFFVYFTDKNNNAYLPCLFSGDKVYIDKKNKKQISIERKKIIINTGYCVVSNIYGMGYILFNPGEGVSIGSKEFKEKLKEGIKETNKKGYKLSYLLNTDYGLGAMYYLFNSFLTMSENFIINIKESIDYQKISDLKGIGISSFYILVKSIFIFFLLIPLFLFVLVLVIRVFYIWIIIIISPILVFFWGLGFSLKGFLEKFSLTSVLTLIFLPAVAMFSLSIGILFLNAIETTFYNIFVKGTKDSIDIGIDEISCGSKNQMGIQVPGINLGLCIKVKDYASDALDISLNVFWYIMFNFFVFIILWAILMASLKTSKITSGFVSSVEGFVKDVAKAIPLPTPLGKLSVGSAQTGWKHISSQPASIIGNQFTNSKLAQIFSKMVDDKKEVIQQRINNFVNTSSSEPIGSDKLKKQLFDFIMSAKWGNYGSIFDYEDQILSVINRAFNKKFNNLKEALTDDDVLNYFLSQGEDISKFVDKLFDSNYKRQNIDEYNKIVSNIYRKIEDIIKKNGGQYLKNHVYKYQNKLYKFIYSPDYKVVGVDTVNIDQSNKSSLEKLIKFVNENSLDLNQIIPHYESKEYKFNNAIYKIKDLGGTYILEKI